MQRVISITATDIKELEWELESLVGSKLRDGGYQTDDIIVSIIALSVTVFEGILCALVVLNVSD